SLPHRLDGQTADVDRCAATRGARQTEAGRASRQYRSDARVGPGSRRLRYERSSATAPGAKARDAAQPADAHVRVQLSALGSECRSLSQSCPRQSVLAADAADVRAWLQ